MNKLRHWFKEGLWFLPLAIVFMSAVGGLRAWIKDEGFFYGFGLGLIFYAVCFAVIGLVKLVDYWAREPYKSSYGSAESTVEGNDADAPRPRAW